MEELSVLQDLLTAIREAQKVGCINHLDCWDKAKDKWYKPIQRAEKLVKGD